jgi:hypothetical protein
MKKQILLVIILTIISIRVFSQIEKGTILLGGHATMKASTSGGLYFSFNPNSGFFLTDKICIGASIPLIYMDNEFLWGVTPFGRYYFTPDKAQSVFASCSSGITNFNANLAFLSAGIGNVWFINKNTGFEAEIIGNTDFEDFSAGLFLGFHVYFNRPDK